MHGHGVPAPRAKYSIIEVGPFLEVSATLKSPAHATSAGASAHPNSVISADLSHTAVFGVGAPLTAAAADPPEPPGRSG